MLRKISRILYLVAGILSIVSAVSNFTGGIVLIVLGVVPQVKQMLVDGLVNGTITSTLPGSVEEQAQAIQLILLIVGIILLLTVVILVTNSVLSFIGRKNDSKAVSIINIVVGVLSGTELNAAAGVLSLISKSNEPEVVE